MKHKITVTLTFDIDSRDHVLVSEVSEQQDLKSLLSESVKDRFNEARDIECEIVFKECRSYKRPIFDIADIMTVDEWKQAVMDGTFISYDGNGYWCKDGMESRDEVFETLQEDATHVAWYNK